MIYVNVYATQSLSWTLYRLYFNYDLVNIKDRETYIRQVGEKMKKLYFTQFFYGGILYDETTQLIFGDNEQRKNIE